MDRNRSADPSGRSRRLSVLTPRPARPASREITERGSGAERARTPAPPPTHRNASGKTYELPAKQPVADSERQKTASGANEPRACARNSPEPVRTSGTQGERKPYLRAPNERETRSHGRPSRRKDPPEHAEDSAESESHVRALDHNVPLRENSEDTASHDSRKRRCPRTHSDGRHGKGARFVCRALLCIRGKDLRGIA